MSEQFVAKMIDNGFYKEVVQVWSAEEMKELLPIQEQAIQKGVLNGQNLLVVAPTSSGKTFIGEMASIQHVLDGKQSIFLFPFKALAEEKFGEFNRKYGKLGFKIKISDKDHREHDEEINNGDYDIAIMTYEKLVGMLINSPNLLSNCSCIVVDEVQMIGDSGRGATLELLLTKLKEMSTKIQIIALSAVLDELSGFDKWLEAELIQVKERPVELRQGILFTDQTFEYKEWNSGLIKEEKINANDLFGLVEYLLNQKEQVVIIKNSVPSTYDLAEKLAEHFNQLPSATKVIGILKEEAESETRDKLLYLLKRSIAFHNAECELEERLAIEQGFKDGLIKIIVATTTLSMGVNLPCKTVILADHQKWANEQGKISKVKWPVAEVRNIFGRAGRLTTGNMKNPDEFGRGIFIASSSKEREALRRSYINASLESLKSAFENKDINLRVLDIIASGFGTTEEQVTDFLFKTFAAQSWTHENARPQIQKYIHEGVKIGLTHGFIEEDSFGKLKITEIGKACVSTGCSIESAVMIQEYLESISTLDQMELLFMASQTEEVGKHYYRGIYWENEELQKKISYRLTEEADKGLQGKCLNEYERIESRGGRIFPNQLKAFTFALLATDILEKNISTKEIKKAYGISNANLRDITTNLSWMLDVASRMASSIIPEEVEKINSINNCIIHKTPLACNYLNKAFIKLNREEKVKLIEAGFLTIDDFLEKIPSDFKGIIHPDKANKIILNINQKREESLEYWEKEHARRIDILGLDTQLINDLYNVKGIDLERKVCKLFEQKFIDCEVERLTDQREAEPDLLVMFANGERMTIQVTGKDKKTAYVDAKKAGEVILQSHKQQPNSYMCLGRPDFQDIAISQAQGSGNQHSFKLMPLSSLIELYVRVCEEKLTVEQATEFLQTTHGYLNNKSINNFFSKVSR